MPESARAGPVQALLFDMDNTLFDLIQAQITACAHVARHLGKNDGKELFDYFLHAGHGFESTENIRQYMVERGLSTDGMFDRACRIYRDEKLNSITPYPGVMQSVREIRSLGLPMVIVTDAEQEQALERLGKCGLVPYFDSVITSDLVKKKKPDPEPFLYGLRELGTRPDNALFIGDSPRRDIEPCLHLGIRTVYARYGDRFASERPCTGADFTIDAIPELVPIIRKLARIP